MEKLKQMIIEECKKYGYELLGENNSLEKNEVWLFLFNENQVQELQVFDVRISKDLEMVSMALVIDLGSWNEATDSDINDLDDIRNNIANWLSVENLKEIQKWLGE